MAEGMIEEFHRYLMDIVELGQGKEKDANLAGDTAEYYTMCGYNAVAKTILEEYEKRFLP